MWQVWTRIAVIDTCATDHSFLGIHSSHISRKTLSDQQIVDILTSTPLCESEGEEFDSDSEEEYNPPLNKDSSDDSIINETPEEITNADENFGKY